ncbi:hypothetical protein [Nocardia sp. NPDC049149]|uniref:hypothetical protein n=1 Tax=Nocardia sp. NPDC049149 TaxID=3364315 RepID=UPI00371FA28A
MTTDPLHALLLGLAGRIPDSLLTDLRYSLALGDRLEIAYAVVAIARRRTMALLPAEHAVLSELLAHQPGGPSLVDEVPVTATLPPSTFRFTPISPAAVRETGMATTGDAESGSAKPRRETTATDHRSATRPGSGRRCPSPPRQLADHRVS